MEKFTGYTSEEIIGKSALKLFPFNEKYGREEFLTQALNGKIVTPPDFIYENSSGEKRWFSAIYYPNHDIEGHIIGIICQVTDVTDRKQFEHHILNQKDKYELLNDELRKTNNELKWAKEKAEESDQLKTVFLNNMSHEIRTPMNGIMGFAEFLTNPDISPEDRKYFSEIIRNSSHQLLRIIDDILEISRLETQQVVFNPNSFSLNDLIIEVNDQFRLLSNERKIPVYIKSELSELENVIVSDRNKLEKIISNILENAFKYTFEGFIEISCHIIQGTLKIQVKDTGIGIEPEMHQSIFERFNQVNRNIAQKTGGLGIGLSIARENAHILGGDVIVKSEKGKGAVFIIEIPHKTPLDEAESSAEEQAIKRSGELKNPTILIAEDEEVNYLFLEALLNVQKDFNCQILWARNGKEAVEICEKDIAIDLILMDLKMPLVSGHEAARQIKALRPEVRIIAQTAYSSEEEKKEALNAGCDDFISKPINRQEIMRKMNALLQI